MCMYFYMCMYYERYTTVAKKPQGLKARFRFDLYDTTYSCTCVDWVYSWTENCRTLNQGICPILHSWWVSILTMVCNNLINCCYILKDFNALGELSLSELINYIIQTGFSHVWYTIERNDITLLLLNATEIHVLVLDEYPFKLKKINMFS